MKKETRTRTIVPGAMLGKALRASCGQHLEVQLTSEQDTISWAMGVSYAKGLTELGIPYNKEVLLAAVDATLSGEPSLLDEQTLRDVVQRVNQDIAIRAHARQQTVQQEGLSREEDYFAELKSTHPSLFQTPSGIYYEVVKKGNGRNAKWGDVVEFDYRARVAGSSVPFDQTYGNREPIKHVVGNPMFEGMQEAFSLMNAGSVYHFYFPSRLAFGSAGNEDVPPYTPVEYEIELHSIR